MSVAVALKHDGKVYVGVDSQISCGADKYFAKSPNNLKMWPTLGLDHSYMLHTGVARDLAVLKYTNYFPSVINLTDSFDFEYAQSTLVFNIYESLKDRGLTEDKEGNPQIQSSIILTYKDKIYNISQDLYVLDVDEFTAEGSGKDAALGSLESTRGLDPERRIVEAIKAAAEVDLCVGFPIIISNTFSDEYIIVNEEDIEDSIGYEL